MTKLTLVAAAMLLNSAAFAAGIDSRAYTCTGLQSLVAAQRFVFISQATFGDFVVSDAYYCGSQSTTQLREIATSDRPNCPLNSCVRRNTRGGG